MSQKKRKQRGASGSGRSNRRGKKKKNMAPVVADKERKIKGKIQGPWVGKAQGAGAGWATPAGSGCGAKKGGGGGAREAIASLGEASAAIKFASGVSTRGGGLE